MSSAAPCAALAGSGVLGGSKPGLSRRWLTCSLLRLTNLGAVHCWMAPLFVDAHAHEYVNEYEYEHVGRTRTEWGYRARWTSDAMFCFGAAPTILPTTSPFLNTKSVGTPLMP